MRIAVTQRVADAKGRSACCERAPARTNACRMFNNVHPSFMSSAVCVKAIMIASRTITKRIMYATQNQRERIHSTFLFVSACIVSALARGGEGRGTV